MSLGIVLFLAFVALPLGLVLAAIGGLLTWRGPKRRQGSGMTLLFVGGALALSGGYAYYKIAQVNWGL